LSLSGKLSGGRVEDSPPYPAVAPLAVRRRVLQIEMLNGAPVIRVHILGQARTLIVDTGSSISLVQPGVCSSKLTPTNITPFGVTGDGLKILGEQHLALEFGEWHYRHRFCVCSLATQADGIIGLDIGVPRGPC
jgi:hypothetical protein